MLCVCVCGRFVRPVSLCLTCTLGLCCVAESDEQTPQHVMLFGYLTFVCVCVLGKGQVCGVGVGEGGGKTTLDRGE